MGDTFAPDEKVSKPYAGRCLKKGTLAGDKKTRRSGFVQTAEGAIVLCGQSLGQPTIASNKKALVRGPCPYSMQLNGATRWKSWVVT